MAHKAFCIHGHFYQPPREDPITGEIPQEPGAAPYHNWNERIFDQCYRPNAELGNFEAMSFNIGPTLAMWLKQYNPPIFHQIIEADRRNWKIHSTGNAMAQAYSHVILPLASKQDKITQVRWGIQDFFSHFGHQPDGMWLPETAVDLETLEILALNGIEFTILAPWQAEAGNLDVTKPYLVRLPGGRKITVFFYDDDLSMRVSFQPEVTVNGDCFARDFLAPKFKKDGRGSENPQLVMIASDGELYGHHQPFRDKFLEYVLNGALKPFEIEATYPGLWLKQHPAEEEISIRENTSWSCHHGVLRWSGVCECAQHAEWKKPLRRALNEIAGMVDRFYLLAVEPYLEDPWELRHGYARVLCKEITIREYIRSSIPRELNDQEIHRIRYLLAAQYERQRMFTSCGWFFDDFDRIEPRNNIAYAAQAVWLLNEAIGIDLSKQAAEALRPVVSWRSGLRADVLFNHHLRRAQKMNGPQDLPRNGDH